MSERAAGLNAAPRFETRSDASADRLAIYLMIASYLWLLQKHGRVLVFAGLCAFLSGPGQTFFVSLFVLPIQQAVGLSYGEIGAIYFAASSDGELAGGARWSPEVR